MKVLSSSRILSSVLLVVLVAQAMCWNPYGPIPSFGPFTPDPYGPYPSWNPYGPIPSFGPYTPDPYNPPRPPIPSFDPDFKPKECGLGCSNCDSLKCKSCYGYYMEHKKGGIGLEWDCSGKKADPADNCLEYSFKEFGKLNYKQYCSKCKIGYSLIQD